MEIIKIILAIMCFTIFVAMLSGVFLYCVSFIYTEEIDEKGSELLPDSNISLKTQITSQDVERS